MNQAAPRHGRTSMTVVAGVIVRTGTVLIGQRPHREPHGGRWEFPGGKVEPHEEPRAALARELREELAICAEIGPELDRYEYRYPGRSPIQLIFYRVTQFSGDPVNLAFEQILWERLERLTAYDFLDGDLDFVHRLASGKV